VFLFAFSAFFGILINRFNTQKIININYVAMFSKKGFFVIWALYIFSLLFFIYEHYVFYTTFNAFPIQLYDFEIKRLLFALNGYVHLIAMMSYIFLFLIFFETQTAKRGNKYKVLVCFFLLVTIFLGAMIGNRGVIINFIFLIFFTRSLFIKYSVKKTFFISCFFLYFLGVAKFYRDYMFYGDDVYGSLDAQWAFGSNLILAPLYYLYQTLVMNLEFLNMYLNASFEYTLGYFSILSPILSIFPIDLVEMKEFQTNAIGIDFYGTLTSTGIGTLYIDFGPFFFLGIFFWFWFLAFIYKLIFSTGKVLFVPLYSYLFLNVMFFSYTYTFNKFYVLLNIFFLMISPHLFRKGHIHK
jgi:oligosaccharide repeat unit polymerase